MFCDLLLQVTATESFDFWASFRQMLVSLAAVCSLILVTAWFLKRFMKTRLEQINSGSTIKILERRNLTPKSVVYLLDIEGKKVLIAESQTGVHMLTEFFQKTELSESNFKPILQSKVKE